ncbi:MAG: translation initiation factor IF-3 [Micavibrio sp.]|nr:translation initiation factor IF-3 [Micavibrio sp.]
MIIRRPFRGPQKDDGPRTNEDITASKVRLINQDGDMVGVVSLSEAIETAANAGLDLVEVSPDADPPVCKILDYGKYKYEQQKKAAEARKKQKTVDVKEVKIRPTTEEHDYQVKLKAARRFLKSGDKVKVSMRFRGREMAHQDVGMEMMIKLRDDLSDLGGPELDPKMEGRQMLMVISGDAKPKPKAEANKDDAEKAEEAQDS